MSLKEKIIDESLKLFSLKGFSNTSLADIIKTSGASKGGFYNHFKSKEILFSAVLDRARLIWKHQGLQGLDDEKKSINKLKKFLRNHCEKYLIDSKNFPGGCIFITLSVELNDYNPNLSKEIDKVFGTAKGIIWNFFEKSKELGELKAGVDIDSATEVVFAGLLGSSVIYGADKSIQSLSNSINALIHYIEGLEA